MKSAEEYMQIAIKKATYTSRHHGVAIGAILVDNESGEVIATGGSEVDKTHDPTSHAEINCIRKACKQIQSDDLYGYTLYSTLEPCHMCLSAAAWARIPRIFFGAYKKDVDDTLFDIKGDFSDEDEGSRMNLREKLAMHVVGGVLEADCSQLLRGYHDSPKHG